MDFFCFYKRTITLEFERSLNYEFFFWCATFRTFIVGRNIRPCRSRSHVILWVALIFVINMSAVITLHSFHSLTSRSIFLIHINYIIIFR